MAQKLEDRLKEHLAPLAEAGVSKDDAQKLIATSIACGNGGSGLMWTQMLKVLENVFEKSNA